MQNHWPRVDYVLMTLSPFLFLPLTHLLVSDRALENTFLGVVDEGAAGPVAAATCLMVGLAVACLVLAVVSGAAQLVQSVGVVTSGMTVLGCTAERLASG